MDEKDIEHRLTEVEGRSKSNTHRLDDLERRQDNLDDLVSTVKVLAVREENVENVVKEIKNDVKSIKAKPGQRFDAIIDKVIWAVLAAVIAFILGKIGF
jgi:hypothetical protein